MAVTNSGRRRSPPKEIVERDVNHCPKCGKRFKNVGAHMQWCKK